MSKLESGAIVTINNRFRSEQTKGFFVNIIMISMLRSAQNWNIDILLNGTVKSNEDLSHLIATYRNVFFAGNQELLRPASNNNLTE